MVFNFLKDFATILFDRNESFFDINTFDKSRMQIYKELCSLAPLVGVESDLLMRHLEYNSKGNLVFITGLKNDGNMVTASLKQTVRISRHNHVHVSPTVLVDGLEVGKISSSWTLEEWKAYLESLE